MGGAELPLSRRGRGKNIQGRVVLSFVVKPDCTVEDVKVIKGADPMLDAEAIRVVKQLKFDKSPRLPGGQSRERMVHSARHLPPAGTQGGQRERDSRRQEISLPV